uniref:Centrosomal protein 85 n=1 Tax=Latimeria chalumnae TaxID=7897 RepID=H3BBB5_LATCH
MAVAHKENSSEWQTPALSERFQSRLGRRPSTADSGDTAIGTSCSDSTEDFCNSSGSSSFQPIRTQVAIPTAHVMPSTIGSSPNKKDTRPVRECFSSSKLDSHSCLDARSGDPSNYTKMMQVDPRNLYLIGTKKFDHSLFPNTDLVRPDEMRKFDTPAIESTLNQSALLEAIYTDSQCTRGEFLSEMDQEGYSAFNPAYKLLPESKCTPAGSCPYGQQNGYQPSNVSPTSGLQPSNNFSAPLVLQSHMLCDQIQTKPFDIRLPERYDLAVWQQQKQMENIRLQVEQMQLINGAPRQYPPVYSSFVHQDPSKWDALLKANEGILKEKELMIERQREQISQLERKMRESDLQVQNALLGRTVPYGDICMLRLQETLRENTFLRAQFAEKSESFGKEKTELERKLAMAEMEMRPLNEKLNEMTKKHAEEMKKQEERVRSRDKHINSLKKKCQKESEQNQEKQNRIETLERYLADLPTMEDYQKQSRQLKELELKSAQLQDTIIDLENKLGDVRAVCREKDLQLEAQKCKEVELVSSIHSLQEKVERCLEDGVRLPVLDIEKLKCENKSLKEECERVKKIAEKQQKKAEQLASQIRSLEERVTHEEETSQALREELTAKDNGLQQLRMAVKELSAQNQELIDRNLTLQEQLGQVDLSRQPKGETIQLTQKLHAELGKCLYDLQSVCNILTHRAQGKDPNLSLLLGIRSSQHFTEEGEDWQNPEVLGKKLTEVRVLHQEIEDLRTTISDRYAQDMGDNCITQ